MILLTSVAARASADAQVVPGTGSGISTMAADRERLGQITGRTLTSNTANDTTRRIRPLYPTLRFANNSDLPSGGNDGALWAGRGSNLDLSGGLTYGRMWQGRRVDVVFSPELSYSANRPFPLIAGRRADRSAYGSPWHIGASSADLPLRFGDVPLWMIGPGQSSVTITTSRVAFGASTANEWWGPAIRNTLLLSNNAAGVPRLFARTAQPLHTRFGDFAGRAMIGALTESPFFDYDKGNDTRSLSGLLVTYRPALDTGLTLGVSRLVMARATSPAGVIQHALDVAVHFEPIQSAADTSATGGSYQATDQLFSLFARWVFPASGFETYVEWARMELPRSLLEFVDVPQNTQGYTIGLQWADPRRESGFLRVQAEVTYLEQTPVITGRPQQDFYSGRASPQGFTQRGQILGAAIGPGASSQFLAADWMTDRWQAGLFAGRTRTENDALYRQPGAHLEAHDVTIYSGVRGGIRLPWSDVSGDVSVGRRLNYLFQSDFYLGDPKKAVDIQNIAVTLTVSPR